MMKGKKDMIIENVRTVNFPFELIDGEEHYPLLSAAVVENFVKLIPVSIRPAVTLDYDQIPKSYFHQVKTELGIVQSDPQTAEKNERKLLEALENEGAFKR